MLRPGWEPPKAKFNVISNWGGLGDQIARIPVYKWIHDTQTYTSMTIYIQDYFLDLARYLLPETERLKYGRISDLGQWRAVYSLDGSCQIGLESGELLGAYMDFSPERTPGSLGLHLTQQAFLALTDRLAESREALAYPKPPRVPMLSSFPRMIIFTVAFTAPAREWPAKEVNRLARTVREAGYAPVLLGNTEPQQAGDGVIKGAIDDGIDRSLFLDLTNQTTLIEALGIMQRARAVVGVDNGLLHLAHCTSTQVVMGFTNMEARHRLPVRASGKTIALEAEVACKGCQSRGVYINANYKYCLFGDYACTQTMSSERFVQGLKELRCV
jgi:hypothetical protein